MENRLENLSHLFDALLEVSPACMGEQICEKKCVSASVLHYDVLQSKFTQFGKFLEMKYMCGSHFIVR